MPYVRPVFKMRVDKTTGKRVPKLDEKGKHIQTKKWRLEIHKWDGNREFITLRCKNEAKAKRQADRLQLIQDEIKAGNIVAPAKKRVDRLFSEIVDEYFGWGNAQGGRNGRPWSKGYSRTQTIRMNLWRGELAIKYMDDLDGILAKVEKVCQRRLTEGKAGKTVRHEAMALHTFCIWAKKRKYLETDPLEDLGSFNATPKSTRRAMAHDEIDRLLAASPPHRRLLYETALCSGLRAEELRHLTADHIDVEASCLKLEADWTKNRKAGRQPLPRTLVGQLLSYAKTDDAKKRYTDAFARSGAPLRCPDNPLLYVPRATATTMDVDLRHADIPKHTKEGKLDFHALRVAYINNLLAAGMDGKTAQTMARHSTLDMTMNVYARTSEDRLMQAAECAGQFVFSGNSTVTLPEPRRNAENFNKATPGMDRGCNEKELVPATGHG